MPWFFFIISNSVESGEFLAAKSSLRLNKEIPGLNVNNAKYIQRLIAKAKKRPEGPPGMGLPHFLNITEKDVLYLHTEEISVMDFPEIYPIEANGIKMPVYHTAIAA